MVRLRSEEDIVIEPASDEDVIYGDDSTVMEGTSTRPYIRLTSQLRNQTKNEGETVRMRCEAVGTAPIKFSWTKNHAPVELSRRVRTRDRESSSRLIISNVAVLDSGFYQCIANNSASVVNSTAILRVRNVPPEKVKTRPDSRYPSTSDYDEYEMEGGRGRLPDEEDKDLYDNEGSQGGYAPHAPSERWLDNLKIHKGDCIQYKGEACRLYLVGRHIRITSDNKEEMYDIDRNLRAAMIFIENSKNISPECKRISHAVACYHMYKVCDPHAPTRVHTICKSDCTRLTSEVCPAELRLASEHELVGDGPKALFPACPSLQPDSDHCIPVLRSPYMKEETSKVPLGPQLNHWCYADSGKSYRGHVSVTKSGKTCIDWEHSTSHDFNVVVHPELSHSFNYCRNPGGKKTQPWCYSSPVGQEEYCDIPKCPTQMFPENKDSTRPSMGTSISSLWDGLSPQWHLGLLAGGVLMGILLLLLCCLCCCHRKKGKHRAPVVGSGPQSVVNSVSNSTYYRKLNGTSTPMTQRAGNGQVEMATLLPPKHVPPPYEASQPLHVREIPAGQLKLREMIGEGQFGIIHSGIWTGVQSLQVAVKTVRPDTGNAGKAMLEEEIRTIASFDHPHVIRLLGVSWLDSGRIGAVFAYMVHGDVHDLLRLRAPSSLDEMSDQRLAADAADFIKISTQIASGMEYLSSMDFVHRDLATRNCLVEDHMVIKIAHFGLMRPSHMHDYYKVQHRAWMPIRWMSREAIEQGRFSQKSDVWAFGVTLWEIYAYGKQPYEGFSNEQVSELLSSRHLLECPPHCPTNMYSLMVECWHENADRRPSFSELHARLQTWSATSPAHSFLQSHAQRTSSSSHSGSSTGVRRPAAGRPPHLAAKLRPDDSSPLMVHEPAYAYTDEEVESD